MAPVTLAAVNGADLVAGAALLAFAAWGAMRGALRQVLGLVVLAAAFLLAGTLAPSIEPTVAKVVTLTTDSQAVVAWATVFLGIVAAGGVVIHMLKHSLDRARLARQTDAVLGALIGVAKGAIVLAVLAYGALGWYADEEGPAFVQSLRESRSAEVVVRVEGKMRPLLGLPPRVAARVERVNERVVIPTPATRRP